jgi:hypothetical protein
LPFGFAQPDSLHRLTTGTILIISLTETTFYRKFLILAIVETTCPPSLLLGSSELQDTDSASGLPFVGYHSNLWLTIFTGAPASFM